MGLEARPEKPAQLDYPANVEPVKTFDGSTVLIVRSRHDRPNTFEEVRGAHAIGLETGGSLSDYRDVPDDYAPGLLSQPQYERIAKADVPFYLTDAPALGRLKSALSQGPTDKVKLLVQGLGVLGLLAGFHITRRAFRDEGRLMSRRGFLGGALAASGVALAATDMGAFLQDATDPKRHLLIFTQPSTHSGAP